MSTFNARVQMKRNTDAAWEEVAATFVPLEGEICIYMTSHKFKVGDGITAIGNLPFCGGGGVCDYGDLENAPLTLRAQSFSQADSMGTGTFVQTTMTKVSEEHFSLTDLIGGTIEVGGEETALSAENTMEVSGQASAVGFGGESCVVMTPSGNWSNMDEIMISLDAAWTLAQYNINLEAGTYIASTVEALNLPETVVVNPDYAGNLLSTVSEADNGKGLAVIGGKWATAGKNPIAGIRHYSNLARIVGGDYAEAALPLWSQISAYHKTFGQIDFDVVHHDTTNHKMTLLMSELRAGFEFDGIEACCVLPSGLAAGNYYIDCTSSTYSDMEKNWQFTLTEAVPANGLLRFSMDLANWVPNGIWSYALVTDTEPIESVEISEGTTGTELHTIVTNSGDWNHVDRGFVGSGNYAQSAFYKWLTSDLESGWWTPSHKFDMAPSYVNQPGFLWGFDSDFLAILENVTATCATNSRFEIDFNTNDSYTVSGKMFLPSYTELCGGTNNNVAEGTQWGAFASCQSGQNNEELVKHLVTDPANPWFWWQRSCNSGNPERARLVNSDGYPNNVGSACNPFIGFAAACVIAGI